MNVTATKIGYDKDSYRTVPIGNGSLPLVIKLPLFHKTVTIHGGPYTGKPDGFFGVCLRETVPANKKAHIHLPIDDFSVPSGSVKDVQNDIVDTLVALLKGAPVYAGCMGGWGRTGLFLALLAKAVGEPEPVSYVRRNYTPRAVETSEQEAYVQNFPVRFLLLKALWKRYTGL